ncbi:MAG: hypothetical protein ACYDAQ_06075 [Mycobacteriales bacterium]
MKPTGNIAVGLPEPQITTARQAVREGRAASVSDYVSEALARRQQDMTLLI